MAREINLQAVFQLFSSLEQRYLPGAPSEHDILLILGNTLLSGEAMLVNDLIAPDEHLHLVSNILRIAYQVGKSEATSG